MTEEGKISLGQLFRLPDKDFREKILRMFGNSKKPWNEQAKMIQLQTTKLKKLKKTEKVGKQNKNLTGSNHQQVNSY